MARAVPRDHVGLPRAGGAAQGRLPRARGHVQRAGGAQALRRAVRGAAAAPRSTKCSAGRSRAPRSSRVVPVENSTEGAVGRTLDLLSRTPLRICGEVELRVHQYLMCEGGKHRRAISARSTRTRSRSRSASGWLDAASAAAPSACRCVSNAEAAQRAAQGGGRGRDRRRGRRRALRPQRARARHRGRPEQHDALPGARAADAGADRQRPDLARHVGATTSPARCTRCSRRSPSTASA